MKFYDIFLKFVKIAKNSVEFEKARIFHRQYYTVKTKDGDNFVKKKTMVVILH